MLAIYFDAGDRGSNERASLVRAASHIVRTTAARIGLAALTVLAGCAGEDPGREDLNIADGPDSLTECTCTCTGGATPHAFSVLVGGRSCAVVRPAEMEPGDFGCSVIQCQGGDGAARK
jgi:hypothetical protein